MKDDLISRKAAIDALEFEMDCLETPERITGVEDAIEVIRHLSFAPAVPLDKLCEFLEKCGADSYCGTCKQIMGGCFTDGKGCGSEHFWKKLLTKWMEKQNG